MPSIVSIRNNAQESADSSDSAAEPPADVPLADNRNAEKLEKTLLPRHITMMSLGGTIGAGLFIGIAEPLTNVGPLGAMIAYLLAGLVMLATMMCLGELSCAMPSAGSFQYYLYKLFPNPIWSFVVGWLYWLSWVFALAAGLIAAGIITNELFPAFAVWQYSLFFLVSLLFFNSLSANAFGETEYWLAGVKVFAIVFFIFSGLYLLYVRQQTGWMPTLQVNGSYFPHGSWAILTSMAVVIYSFQGAELIGNVAAETPHPEKTLPKVIRGVGVRIILFYVLAVGILALLNPYGYTKSDSGPFVDVFRELGIPATDTLMKLVILSAALSAANSAIYACSRMFWTMANERMAPTFFQKLSGHHVPLRAIMLCGLLSLVCLFSKSLSAQRLFLFLIASTAQVGCLAWIVIGICLLKYRALVRKGELTEPEAGFKTPLPCVTAWAVIVINMVIIVGGWFSEDGLNMLIAEGVITLLVLLGYWGAYRRRNPSGGEAEQA